MSMRYATAQELPPEIFAWMRRWSLSTDGSPLLTANSLLQPVRMAGKSAMLKLALQPEEIRGTATLPWFAGLGGVLVYAQQGPAAVIERATRSLDSGTLSDNEQTGIACTVIARLHAPRRRPRPQLVPLEAWFSDLLEPSSQHSELLQKCKGLAEQLLGGDDDRLVLHGDIHHGNIMQFPDAAWRAIDPKGLVGNRCFDYANLFCNPDLATASANFDARLAIVSRNADIPPNILCRWIAAYAGLSICWHRQDGTSPDVALAVATRALSRLN